MKGGHTLGAIARRYHTTTKAIERDNRLKPGQHIHPGQKLKIIVSDEPPRAARRRGDTHRAPSRKRTHKSAKHKPSLAAATARLAATRQAPSNAGADRTLNPSGWERRSTAGRSGERAQTQNLMQRYARKPPRPGYLTLIRFSEQFKGQLVDRQRRVLPAAHSKVSRLLRDIRARQQVPVDRRLLRLLADVSDYFGGRPIVIVSGFRMYDTHQYTNDSRHNYGQALDFRIVGVPNEALRDYCLGFSRVGLGYYPNSTFIHLDTREHKATWIDRSRPGKAPRYAKREPRARRSTTTSPKANRPGRTGAKQGTTPKRSPARNPEPVPQASRSGARRPRGGKAAAP